MGSNDTNKRSIAKGLCYRGLGSLVTILIAFFITGSWPLAGAVAIFEFIAKIVLYYLHERLWNFVKWGKE